LLPKEWSAVELETKTFAAPAKGDMTETKINNSRAAICGAAKEKESTAQKELEANALASGDDEVKGTGKPSILINETKYEENQVTVIAQAAVTTETRQTCCRQMGNIQPAWNRATNRATAMMITFQITSPLGALMTLTPSIQLSWCYGMTLILD
jgi:hypothetical protein